MTPEPVSPAGRRDEVGRGSWDPLGDHAELNAILAARTVRPLFQPIVDLALGEPVAFEALSRGPVASVLHRPERLFEAARAAGCLSELDGMCRARALEAVAASGLHSRHVVFVNREPQAVSLIPLPPEHQSLLDSGRLRMVVEFTERNLSRDPAMLLAYTAGLRARGVGVALDDVGVDADSLALMPFLMPDVVKLDMALLHRRPDSATVQVLSAVRAHAERRGALILAEGIETAEHERLALAMGATLGQGWRYGRPGPLPEPTNPLAPPSRPLVLRNPEQELATASPFAMATRAHPPLRGPADLLFALRRQLTHDVESLSGLAVVLLSCIDAPTDSRQCAEHYTALATSARFAALLGTEMPEEVVPGLRGSRLSAGDPVGSEWDMVVVSPHFAAAIIAKERDDAFPEEKRVFDYVLTYDRTLVVDVARSLMMRALPLDHADPEVARLLR